MLLRLVGMAVGIQAAKDAVETQVCEIENGHLSAHWKICSTGFDAKKQIKLKRPVPVVVIK